MGIKFLLSLLLFAVFCNTFGSFSQDTDILHNFSPIVFKSSPHLVYGVVHLVMDVMYNQSGECVCLCSWPFSHQLLCIALVSSSVTVYSFILPGVFSCY